jgi:hypothetical protein
MQQESAQVIALQALEWLAGNEELFATFVTSTGASVSDLARQVQDPDFLAAILDFLLMNDDWVKAFCDIGRLPYTSLMEARAVLAGGPIENWT